MQLFGSPISEARKYQWIINYKPWIKLCRNSVFVPTCADLASLFPPFCFVLPISLNGFAQGIQLPCLSWQNHGLVKVFTECLPKLNCNFDSLHMTMLSRLVGTPTDFYLYNLMSHASLILYLVHMHVLCAQMSIETIFHCILSGQW